jgi:hypothetical protein
MEPYVKKRPKSFPLVINPGRVCVGYSMRSKANFMPFAPEPTIIDSSQAARPTLLILGLQSSRN